MVITVVVISWDPLAPARVTAILFRVGMDMLDMHVGLLLEPLGVIHVTNMVLVISMKGHTTTCASVITHAVVKPPADIWAMFK